MRYTYRIFILYLFVDLLDKCEQLDEFDSEDESETPDDDLCKKESIKSHG